MRQISQDAAYALIHGTPFKQSNTKVEAGVLTLHGNPIAKVENGKLFISSAGWETATTKDRLNALPDVSVHQKKGVWYLNNEPWNNSEEWTEV